MHPRKFALAGGISMLLVGLLALLFPGERSPNLPRLIVESSYGQFLGIFPMNIYNKLTLIIFGIAGIFAATASPATALSKSIKWARWLLGLMGIAAVFGIVPRMSTLFGYWPLFGTDILLHGFFAMLGTYFGYLLPSRAAKAMESNSEISRNFEHRRAS